MSANDELQAHTCEKMLEFYGDVAKNVVQANSQQLTEQWKNGELESGWYYIECVDEPHHWIDIDFYRNDCYEDKGFCKGFFDRNDWRGIDKVIAPVPSYDHFVELTEKVKENQQLKELLNECHSGFRKLPIYNLVGEDTAREVNKLLNKIDEVLK